jgi:hypothetical protein
MVKDQYIFITQDGQYVGMDNNSGGYPHISDNPLNAHPWANIEDAKKYRKMFKENWILNKLEGLKLSCIENEHYF